ncbi:MAG: calcium-translocating P-type ATPase, PMCA-type [Cyclobacteriaceae bacterium]|nr:calcium-translocating P-type ATPase, PMCA-type [Cyclobacteriaceae bacterium]
MKYTFEGLSSQQAESQRKIYGSNEISAQKKEGFFDKLITNFKDPIIIILCIALLILVVLSFFGVTEWYEAMAIGVAVLLATLVSTYSEFKNESSFQKLQEEASRITCNVFRNGHLVRLPIGEMVVSDIVLLQLGDKVPADGIIIHGEVKVNQASLTGESESVTKKVMNGDSQVKHQKVEETTEDHKLYRGSVIEDGEAICKVEAVGDNTLYGKLAKELSESDDRLSPLQVKLKGLARLISKFGYIAGSLVFVTFLFNKIVLQHSFDAVLINNYFQQWDLVIQDFLNAAILSIIIVVAAVPEGLPMMIAIVLSLNMRKLLREKVLVRKLLGIETAGSLNILFTDKTGTITKGVFEPHIFISGGGGVYNRYADIPSALREVLCFAIVENTSSIISSTGNVEGGNQSGRALLAFIDKEDLVKKSQSKVKLLHSVLFNSARKFSAARVGGEIPLNSNSLDQVTLINGAPEILLENCTHYLGAEGNSSPLNYEELSSLLEDLSRKGIRLIAIAMSDQNIPEDDSLPEKCTLIGIIGIRDEIRAESKISIEKAQDSGVQIVMLTGDRKGTAVAIASEAGLLNGDKGHILTSEDLQNFSDEELKLILPKIHVVARALPTDKSRLVRIAKSLGLVVGMTGDGVNDSSALKQSDVGFAMGSGSEVSKEASDIVILDDNFSSLSNAIRYGRTIFKSIRKFIIFQLTVNLSAVSIVFLGPFFGIEFPLTIIQLLWINIIMDTLAAIAFGGEPALERFMKEPPIKRDAHILTRDMVSSIITGAVFISAFSLFFLTSDYFKGIFTRNGVYNETVFLTAFFNLFVFFITLNSFNARTERFNLFENISQNKNFIRVISLILGMQVLFTYIGGNVLRATALTMHEWLVIIGCALLIIPIDLTRKLVKRWADKIYQI